MLLFIYIFYSFIFIKFGDAPAPSPTAAEEEKILCNKFLEDQDEFLMRKSEHEEVGLETNNKAVLEDVGQNAELYIIANQEGRGQHAKLGAWPALSFEQRQMMKS